jgi:hypothetical protein
MYLHTNNLILQNNIAMWRSGLLANQSLSQAAPALQLGLAKLDGFKLVNKW